MSEEKRYGKGGVGMTVKAEDLVKLFRQALDEGWGYIWGTYGQVWTRRDQDNATREQTVLYGQKWVGRRVADCSGLGYWAFGERGGRMYHGSNTMWNEYTAHRTELVNGRRADGGEMFPGDPVFMVREADGEKVRHHVGYYVGGGQVIEAKGTASGVVAGPVNRWQETAHWVNLEYPGGVIFRMRNMLRRGSSGMEVRSLQELLTGAGYPLEADGVFGAKTEAAVRAFQADRGLNADGICGKNTWAALEPVLSDAPVQQDRLLLIREYAEKIVELAKEA